VPALLARRLRRGVAFGEAQVLAEAPIELLHAVEHALEPLGPIVVWIGDTLVSAIAGLAVGLVIVGIALVIGKAFGKNLSFAEGLRSGRASRPRRGWRARGARRPIASRRCRRSR
jgi:hypothetical protein